MNVTKIVEYCKDMLNRKPSIPLTASSVLYVGQLPYEWDENVIKSVVCGSGLVVDVRLGYDYAGKNKGFCFVEYQTPQEAQKGLRMLNQIKLLQANGQYKKLRIELSKEGLRSNGPSVLKQVQPLDRTFLPNYVQLPPEMVYNGPPLPPNNGNLSQIPMGFATPGQNTMPGPEAINQFTPQNAFQPPQSTGIKFQNISQNHGQPSQLPFSIPDKISQTLSQIQPQQLLDLIANLKAIMGGENTGKAAEILQMSPSIVPTIAQALLLMGFIDSDVISESMKSTSALPPPAVKQPLAYKKAPSLPQIPTVLKMKSPSIQAQTPTPPMPAQHQQTPTNSRWPHLPPSSVQKLSSLAPDQADLIAQVLTLPPEQINSLPPDKQMMVTNIRAQYL